MNMGELQAKLNRRRLEAMTPEERAAEEAKNNPVITKDAVGAKLAQLESGGGGTQEAPKTAIMVGKGAPPPPPPPPPPPAVPQILANCSSKRLLEEPSHQPQSQCSSSSNSRPHLLSNLLPSKPLRSSKSNPSLQCK
jgi:hypothetical protein